MIARSRSSSLLSDPMASSKAAGVPVQCFRSTSTMRLRKRDMATFVYTWFSSIATWRRPTCERLFHVVFVVHAGEQLARATRPATS